MAFPLINPKTQFFDSSGSPLSSGSIEFRSPTTNDFINSYPTADDADAQTNENANPLELDSSGRASVYLEDGVKYKIILKDADGVTFWTEDDVRAPLYSATSINTVTNAQTAEESAAGAVPVNFEYPPGHALRYGDNTTPGTTDVTSILQTAIDSGVSEVVLPGEDCLVSKTSDFSADFPGDDQPCLFANNKTRLTIRGESGCRLLVNEHAQGILELQGCTDVTIENIQFIGPADYPNIDGTTGYSEKGTASFGYSTAASGIWGFYKNNSNDTSAETGGGFSGAFPQYSGGTASSWGVWNDGFIGNVSFGVLIHNDCHDITVRDCKATGFNYVGFAVGFPGDFSPVDRSYDACSNINFLNCNGDSNYSTGFSVMDCDGFRIEGCEGNDCGHPDATPATDDVADPGYGIIAGRKNTFSYAKNGIVTNNRTNRNVRKGIDIHTGLGFTVSNNESKDNGNCGIFCDWANVVGEQTDECVISNNRLSNNGFNAVNLGQIFIGGPGDADQPIMVHCNDNLLMNTPSRGIWNRYGSNVSIVNNTLIESISSSAVDQAFIDCATDLGNTEEAENLLVHGNNIFDSSGHISKGIRVLYDYVDAVISSNTVKMTNTDPIGIQIVSQDPGVDDPYIHVLNNVVVLGSTGQPYACNQTSGIVQGNYERGGDTVSTLLPNVKEKPVLPSTFSFTITFNNTSTPTISASTASDIVGAASSITEGVRVAFSGLSSVNDASMKATLTVRSSSGLQTSGSTAVAFTYLRALSNGAIEVGLKSGEFGSNIAASAVTDGMLEVVVFYV